jgi:hypothetical protein
LSGFNGQIPSRKTLWFRAVGESDLRTTVKAVAWAIGSLMNANAEAWPSRQTIADSASLRTPKTVDRLVPEIEAAGLVVVRRSGGRVANRYDGTIPGSLWHIWDDDLVERLLELGDLDDSGDNRDIWMSRLESATATLVTSNGDISDANGDILEPNGDTWMSPEVGLEVDEAATVEGPGSRRGRPLLEEELEVQDLDPTYDVEVSLEGEEVEEARP